MHNSHPLQLRAFAGRAKHAAPALAAAGAAALLAVQMAAAAVPENMLNYAGPDREQKLIEGAKKEGQVVFYSAMIVDQALRPIADSFQKKYPFVKVTYWRADSGDTFAKVSAEERAGNVVADVIEGTGVGEPIIAAGFAEPFSTPVITDYPVQYRDPHHMWAATRLSYFGLAYNTRLVPEGTQPKSYADLLNPNWKGKMAWRIGPAGGTEIFISSLRATWGEDKATAYFQKLKQQQIVNFGSGSARTLVDRVIAGEYPIALSIFAHHPLISKAKGAPVNSQLLDPVPVTAGIVVIPKGVRHPYAAMLLVDFVLSREGQGILAKAEYFPANPTVAPLPQLAPVVPRLAGVPEIFKDPEIMLKYNEESERIFQKIFR
jgi:ABC-type Fe3+ transport system substrate-binding protein